MRDIDLNHSHPRRIELRVEVTVVADRKIVEEYTCEAGVAWVEFGGRRTELWVLLAEVCASLSRRMLIHEVNHWKR